MASRKRRASEALPSDPQVLLDYLMLYETMIAVQTLSLMDTSKTLMMIQQPTSVGYVSNHNSSLHTAQICPVHLRYLHQLQEALQHKLITSTVQPPLRATISSQPTNTYAIPSPIVFTWDEKETLMETVIKQSREVEMDRGKKRSFDTAFKLKVVDCTEKSTNQGAAAKYKVDKKSTRTWWKNKASLLALPTLTEKKKMAGGSRKLINLEMD
uniref:Brinker DNA-binding domain-containing protein n=1 Tax=Amphimedon queenslandica TaxID=400682 RepID=A0A1X7U295_AMPQE